MLADSADVAPLQVRPARLFGLLPAKHRRTAPRVVLTRQEDHLRAECTGDASFGGGIPLTESARDLMVELGWHAGGGSAGEEWAGYWPDDVATAPYLPVELVDAAATLVQRTLADVFGCTDPAQVQQVAGAPKNGG